MTRSTPRRGPRKQAPAAPPPAPLPAEVRDWRRGWRVPLALALLHGVLALLAFVPAPSDGGDNAAYVSLARSLLERGRYLELWDPAQRPHTQYPPAFPGLLALAMALGVRSWVGYKLLVLAFSVLGVLLSYLWLRRVTTPGVALAVGVFLAFAPGILELSHWELSDVPFWAFTVLSLWAFAHLSARIAAPDQPDAAASSDAPADAARRPSAPSVAPAPPGDVRRWVALAAVATLLAYLTRSAGLPLVVAAAGWLAWSRRWRALALFAAVVGIPALLWGVRGALVGGAGYLDAFWSVDPYRPELGRLGLLALPGRVLENLDHYLRIHLPALMFGTARVGPAAPVALLALAAAGWARRLRRAGVAELFLPLYAGLMLVWPSSWSGERLVLPVLPLLLLYAAEAVRDAVAGHGRRGVAVAVGTAAVLYVLAVPGLVRQVRTGTRCTARWLDGERYACMTDAWRQFMELGEQARERLPTGSAVLSRKPTLFYVTSGYAGRVYPFSHDPADFLRAAREAGAEYIVADQATVLSPRYLLPVLGSGRIGVCSLTGLVLPRAALLRMDTTALRPPVPGYDPVAPCVETVNPLGF